MNADPIWITKMWPQRTTGA